VTRARKIQRFLSQPMFVSKVFTGIDGINVPVQETIESFEHLVKGRPRRVPGAGLLERRRSLRRRAQGRRTPEGLNMATLKVEVVTPEVPLWVGEATALIARTSEGWFTVLPSTWTWWATSCRA